MYGERFNMLFGSSVTDVSISLRIEIIASQKRSNSATSSDSVGSIIKVPATGKETVDENHNPLSVSQYLLLQLFSLKLLQSKIIS
jgi:hypothetical protein